MILLVGEWDRCQDIVASRQLFGVLTMSKSKTGVKRAAKVIRGASEARLASVIFRQLSEQTRLQILFSLTDGEISGCSLAEAIYLSQTAASHHLAVLRVAKLIASRREGGQTLYSLTPKGQDITRALDGLISAEPVSHRVARVNAEIDPSLLEDLGEMVEDPKAWFNTPNDAFGGRKPLDLLGTSDESRLRNRIQAAKLGMFS